MNRQYYFNYIEERLSTLELRIKNRGSLNILDLNIHSETFFANLIMSVLGISFNNLNNLKPNIEGIDLIDDEQKIVAQVSATCKKQKIEDSLSKIDSEKYSSYRYIFILISGDAHNLRKLTYNCPNSIRFNPQEDIYDIKRFLMIIKELDIDRLKSVYNLIYNELELQNKEITNKDSNNAYKKISNKAQELFKSIKIVDYKIALLILIILITFQVVIIFYVQYQTDIQEGLRELNSVNDYIFSAILHDIIGFFFLLLIWKTNVFQRIDRFFVILFKIVITSVIGELFLFLEWSKTLFTIRENPKLRNIKKHRKIIRELSKNVKYYKEVFYWPLLLLLFVILSDLRYGMYLIGRITSSIFLLYMVIITVGVEQKQYSILVRRNKAMLFVIMAVPFLFGKDKTVAFFLLINLCTIGLYSMHDNRIKKCTRIIGFMSVFLYIICLAARFDIIDIDLLRVSNIGYRTRITELIGYWTRISEYSFHELPVEIKYCISVLKNISLFGNGTLNSTFQHRYIYDTNFAIILDLFGIFGGVLVTMSYIYIFMVIQKYAKKAFLKNNRNYAFMLRFISSQLLITCIISIFGCTTLLPYIRAGLPFLGSPFSHQSIYYIEAGIVLRLIKDIEKDKQTKDMGNSFAI